MKNLLYIFIFPLISITAFWSCGNSTDQKPATDFAEYFDVNGYFKNEVTRLNQEHQVIAKKVMWNEHEDSVQIASDSISWENELALFSELDINKPVNKGLYELSSDSAVLFNYSLITKAWNYNGSANKTPSVLSLAYAYRSDNQKEVMVKGKIVKDDLFAITEIELEYVADMFYKISGNQRIKRTSIHNTFSIQGFFETAAL